MIKKPVLAILALGFAAGASFGQDQEEAEDLFKRKCYMCHRLSADTKMGPGLEGVTVRRTDQWLDEWLENPKAMLEKGDPAAVELVKKYKKVMKTVDAMKDEENRRLMIDYLRENDKQKGVE